MSSPDAVPHQASAFVDAQERGRRLRALKQLWNSTRVYGTKPVDPAVRASALSRLRKLTSEELLHLIIEARLAGII